MMPFTCKRNFEERLEAFLMLQRRPELVGDSNCGRDAVIMVAQKRMVKGRTGED
jgi:hypothetical protein